jgi:arylsulfatase
VAGAHPDKGGLRQQFLHTIDVVPTLYELIGITPPTELNGIAQKPIEGISFAYALDDANAKSRRTTQYFELGCNRGIYHDGWMASAMSFSPWQPNRAGFELDEQKWELYDVGRDFSQAVDLASSEPQKLREMQDLWWSEAEKYSVLPVDWRAVERLNDALMGRRVSPATAIRTPTIQDRSACPTSRAAHPQPFVAAHSRHRGPRRRRRRHDRHARRTGRRLRSVRPPGQAGVRLQLPGARASDDHRQGHAAEGQGEGGRRFHLRGQGRRARETRERQHVRQRREGRGRPPRTHHSPPSLARRRHGRGMDVGSPVDFTYELPFRFTGTIEKVTFDLK